MRKFKWVMFLMLGMVVSGHAQSVIVTQLLHSGQLSWTNQYTNATTTVEWAAEPGGPWYQSWSHLTDLNDTNGGMTVQIPMYYRVSTIPYEPLGMYVVVDISGGSGASSYPVTSMETAPDGLATSDMYRTTHIVLRKIPAGTFMMGSPAGEFGKGSADTDEDQHNVILTEGFYMGVFEVTQAQYFNVMGVNPSDQGGNNRPVETVSWSTIRGSTWPGGTPSASSFMGVLSSKTDLDCDLPTEAQWEYACRAGTTTSLNSGKNLIDPDGNDANANEVAWYYHNSWSQKHRDVGQLAPNNWGLYDMHGNVYEFCLDYYNYSGWSYGVDRTDPVGPTSSEFPHRICRGGSFGDPAEAVRSANRYVQQETGAAWWGGFRIKATTE